MATAAVCTWGAAAIHSLASTPLVLLLTHGLGFCLVAARAVSVFESQGDSLAPDHGVATPTRDSTRMRPALSDEALRANAVGLAMLAPAYYLALHHERLLRDWPEHMRALLLMVSLSLLLLLLLPPSRRMKMPRLARLAALACTGAGAAASLAGEVEHPWKQALPPTVYFPLASGLGGGAALLLGQGGQVRAYVNNLDQSTACGCMSAPCCSAREAAQPLTTCARWGRST